MKKEKYLPIVLVVIVFICTGCKKTDYVYESGIQTEISQAEENNKIILKLASTLNTDMSSLKMLEVLSYDVFEKTNGKVEIQVYPDSQLGDQGDYFKGMHNGTVEMCLVSPTVPASYDEHFNIFGCPGLFETTEQYTKFCGTDIVKEIFENFRKKEGIRELAVYHEGIRDIWVAKKEIHTIEGFKGLKLRVPDVEMSIKKFRELGVTPVIVPLRDVYTGLKSGAIEAIENNVEIITGNNLQNLLDYHIKTNHTYSSLILFISENAYNSMDSQTQKIFLSCIKENEENAFLNFSSEQQKALKTAADAGIKDIELSNEEKEKMNEIWKKVTKETLDGLFDNSVYEVIENCR